MRLISYELGRVIALFPLEEIRPDGGVPLIDTIAKIQERYGFLRAPDLNRTFAEINRDGLLFEGGSFLYESNSIPIREFLVSNDGISISCFDTSHAEAFYNEVMAWGKGELGFKEPLREPYIVYRSIILVEFDKSPNKLIANFEKLSNLIRSSYAKYTKYEAPMNINRIDLRMDDSKLPPPGTITFILERRVSTPHEIERYFSEAPFPSHEHVRILQSIEDMLS